MGRSENLRVVVLIDTENVNARLADVVFQQAAGLGLIVERVAIGDFAGGQGHGWLKCAPRHGVRTIQVAPGARGKNAADIQMTIEAMDLLFRADADVFCLVTMDSDFTPLAIHLRSKGKQVVGFGYGAANKAFRQACDRYIELDGPGLPVPAGEVAKTVPSTVAKKPMPPSSLLAVVKLAIQDAGPDDEGWCALNRLGHALRRRKPDFSAADYGRATLGKLLDLLPELERGRRENGDCVRIAPAIRLLRRA